MHRPGTAEGEKAENATKKNETFEGREPYTFIFLVVTWSENLLLSGRLLSYVPALM